MKHDKYSYDKALELSIELFDTRILKYIKDNLFITDYSKTKAEELHEKAIIDMENAPEKMKAREEKEKQTEYDFVI